MDNCRRTERGNVFFLILAGVILFAALSAAVVSTTRGGKSISDEKARLMAGEILRYAGQIKSSVDHLYQNGVSESDIRFSHPKLDTTDYGDITVNPTYQVFTEEGGGLPYTEPPAEAFTQSGIKWGFTGDISVPRVGTSQTELMAVLTNVKEPVCRQINALLDIETPTLDMTSTNCPFSPYGFTGTYSAIGDFDIPFNPAPLQACAHCVDGGDEFYGFYKVLIER